MIDNADRGKQQPLFPKAQAADGDRNSIDKTDTRSKSGPLTDAKYLGTEQEADLSLSRLHTRRELSNENKLASQVRQDPSLIDTTHSTEEKVQMHEHQRSRPSDVGTGPRASPQRFVMSTGGATPRCYALKYPMLVS